MLIYKILAFLWPFIKEMVLGNKTLTEAIQDNKKKVALAVFIMASLGLNFFLMVRLVAISQKYLEFEKLHTVGTVVDTHTHTSVPVPTALKPKHPAPDAVVEVPAEPVPMVTETPEVPVVRQRANKAVVPKPTKKHPPAPATNEDRYSRMKDTFDRIKEREEKAGL